MSLQLLVVYGISHFFLAAFMLVFTKDVSKRQTQHRLTATAVDTNTGADTDITFMNIPKRGTLHFTKVDADTGAALEGAVFGLSLIHI